MSCPFPGMDPYLERPALWADFHDRLIPAISAALQPLLRPKYAALVQDRLYVVQSKRAIHPDVSVVETGKPQRGKAAAAAVLEEIELDEPVVFTGWPDEIREPYIKIIEPTAGNRLVTAIEVLSPANKLPGEGRRNYLRKHREIARARANLVEIDLLRSGKTTIRIPAAELAKLPPWRYVVAVRRRPRRHEVYPVPLEGRLPRVAIPLARKDPDVPLDLQAAFTRCWQEGAYPELLRYDEPPPGKLTPEELAWCEKQLWRAGFRR